jgi:hypothetical protein
MKKDVDLSRRNFLRNSAGVIVGGAIAGGIGGALLKPRTATADVTPLGYLPRPTDPIDTELVHKLPWRYYGLAGG